MTTDYLPGEGKVSPEEFLLLTNSQTRTQSTRLPPTTISPIPPRRENLAGAARPNMIALDISSEGAENPSCAQRNGSTSSSLN